jgi:hypothetical protein
MRVVVTHFPTPLVVLLLLPLPLNASGDQSPDEFWLDSQRTAAASATQLIAVADPWTAAAVRLHGFDNDLWAEPPLTLDTAPRLCARRLAAVRDDRSFPSDERKLPEELPPEVRAEDAVYWQAVFYAAKVPTPAFARAAAPNRYLTFGHLYTEPAKYRGKVVHFQGRLVRLKRLDPPQYARDRGIEALYEAWIYLDQPGAHPICAIVPHQPAGVDVGDSLRVRVEVDGYFFKRYRYVSGRLDEDGNNVPLSTVLLIGPTLTVQAAPRVGSSSLVGGSFLPWIIGFAVGVVLIMVGMTWWFRRSDHLVQGRLQAVRAGHFADQATALEQTLAGEAKAPGANGAAHPRNED